MRAVLQWLKRLRYGSIINVVDAQTVRISELQLINVELYNKLFDNAVKVKTNISEYHGPMQELRGCKCLKYDKPQSRLKDMIEVAEFNGFNGATYYWYFVEEARLIYPEIDAEPPVEEGELYQPPSRKPGRISTDKAVKPKGSR